MLCGQPDPQAWLHIVCNLNLKSFQLRGIVESNIWSKRGRRPTSTSLRFEFIEVESGGLYNNISKSDCQAYALSDRFAGMCLQPDLYLHAAVNGSSWWVQSRAVTGPYAFISREAVGRERLAGGFPVPCTHRKVWIDSGWAVGYSFTHGFSHTVMTDRFFCSVSCYCIITLLMTKLIITHCRCYN